MNLLQAIILGIVEGLTEFLPVSSTGHQTIVAGLMGLQIDDPSITAFIAVIQVGAIAALVLYLRRDIVRLLTAWVRGLRHAENRSDPSYREAWLVILGSLPIAIVGLLAKNIIEGPLRSLWVVAIALIAWGVVMLIAEAMATQQRHEQDLGLKDALIIGCTQALALIPGVSRSGATISAGLLLGLDRVTAARFGFLLGIPAMAGAAVLEVPAAVKTGGVGIVLTLVGTAVAFVVAYVTVAWMLRFVSRHTIRVFVWYRFALAAVLIVMLSTGFLTATGIRG
ncbi:MAG TPA: undecaprenyl-diphosphate phosphatase [Nakamurella multipartita]|mgnify:CR=1 FL=1|nr:undecaprenyl-diphosphate phosphatase [Nakamurella multipartita]